MEDFIDSSVSSFTNFLSEKKIILKEQKGNNPLVSFALKIPGFQFEKLDSFIRYFERSFYFEKPASKFQLLGLDEALVIQESGDRRFAVTDKKIRELKNNFINNWDEIEIKHIPSFVGGMKFTVEHNDSDWGDFSDSTWFVPELMLLRENGQTYFVFSFLYAPPNSLESVKNKLRNKLEIILKLNSQEKTKNKAEVRKIEGTSPKDKKKWKNLIEQALDKIEDKHIDKVVLSRRVEIILSEEPNFSEIIEQLGNNYPECFLFIYHRGKSTFFGATPEKLADFYNGKIEFDALAGSAPRGKDAPEDEKIERELLQDEKNLNEHKFVIDYIKESISPFTENMAVSKEFTIKKLANIQHLFTKISADLNSSSSMLNLIKELYPTPAICGIPKDSASNIIKKLETHRRGLYSGIIGWFSLNDEGEFAVAIRSAVNINNRVIAFAGGGIVASSNPDAEYKETELKLKPILSLFNNENKNKS